MISRTVGLVFYAPKLKEIESFFMPCRVLEYKIWILSWHFMNQKKFQVFEATYFFNNRSIKTKLYTAVI